MILCIGTTPTAQRAMVFKKLVVDAVNRAVVTVDGSSGKSVNVAKVLRELGQDVVAMGFIGGERGVALLSVLAEQGIESAFVTVPVPTRQCITVIDEAAGTHTELVEESKPVGQEAFGELFGQFERRLPECDAVVMSGTIAPGGMPDLYRRCTELARARGTLAVVDAQGGALTEALAAGPDLIKPNRVELGTTVGRVLGSDVEVVVAARELVRGGRTRVVVTAGKGDVLALEGRRVWRVRAPVIQVVNPTGSGDSFTAAMTWRLVSGDDLGEACRWGAAAGAANALSLMPGELRRADVERLAAEVRVEDASSLF